MMNMSNIDSLLLLPSEVLGIVCNNLCQRDLNALIQTCKTLNGIAAPELYKSLMLKAPIYWSKLPAFESLISSSGRNFDLIQEVHIVAKPDPLKEDQQSAQSIQNDESSESDTSTESDTSAERDESVEDDESSENDESAEDDDSSESDESAENDKSSESDGSSESDYDHLRVFPQDYASKIINVLIRILIARLPKQRLEVFSWTHDGKIEAETISLLILNHGTSLRQLHLRNYKTVPEVPNLITAAALTSLGVSGLRTSYGDPIVKFKKGDELLCRLLAANYKGLRQLQIGAEPSIVGGYVGIGTKPRGVSIPTWVAKAVKKHLAVEDRSSTCSLRLDSLSICGLDFNRILQGGLGLHFNLEILTALKLESCLGLLDALTLFAPHNGLTKTLDAPILKRLFIRHEVRQNENNFEEVLERFLKSLPSLLDLEVLVEGGHRCLDLAPILEVHGENLRRLLWEERSKSDPFDPATPVYPEGLTNLCLVSEKCPHLKCLALPIDWKLVMTSSRYHKKVRNSLRSLENLESLCIRNMPMIDRPSACQASHLSFDHMLKDYAARFMDIVNLGRRPDRCPLLKIFSMGVLLYADLTIDTSKWTFRASSEYLRLRVYQVDYSYQSLSGSSIVLSQIAKGTPSEASRLGVDTFSMWSYWLA